MSPHLQKKEKLEDRRAKSDANNIDLEKKKPIDKYKWAMKAKNCQGWYSRIMIVHAGDLARVDLASERIIIQLQGA